MNFLLFSDKNILMKRIYGCILSLFAFCILHFVALPVSAEENWGVQPQSSIKQDAGETSQKVWNKEESQKIDEYYGSEESPDFLNRGDIDPATSEYNEQYDYEDDEPYNYEAGGT